ncbi:MAG TPA: hypothetical protein VEZ40_00785 [Pyrinomonadaceae bacterium]|nr:hypothetical protein [Pyrinomonadaceae bacterium]
MNRIVSVIYSARNLFGAQTRRIEARGEFTEHRFAPPSLNRVSGLNRSGALVGRVYEGRGERA